MEDNIKAIQNAVWAIWKQFLEDKDVKKYTTNAAELSRKYESGTVEHSFCQDLIFAYVPLVNHTKAKEKANDVRKVGAMANRSV